MEGEVLFRVCVPDVVDSDEEGEEGVGACPGDFVGGVAVGGEEFGFDLVFYGFYDWVVGGDEVGVDDCAAEGEVVV